MTTGRMHSTVIAREIDMTAEIMPAYAYVEMTLYIQWIISTYLAGIESKATIAVRNKEVKCSNSKDSSGIGQSQEEDDWV